MGEDPEDQIAVLQDRIRERLAELRPIPPEDEAHARVTDAVIEATTALIDYEEQLPVLLDRAPRRLSLQVVRWSGVVATALGVSLGMAAVIGWTSRWWLLAAILPCLAGAVLLRTPVPRPREDHLSLRPGAAAVASGSALTTVGAVARLPVALGVAGALLLLTGLWHLRHRQGRMPPPSPAVRRDGGR